MRGCLKLALDRERPTSRCTNKCVAFSAVDEGCIHNADDWDRTPTEPSRNLSYQDILELKEIQKSLPRADQLLDPFTGKQPAKLLSKVPVGLLPLHEPEPSMSTTTQITRTTGPQPISPFLPPSPTLKKRALQPNPPPTSPTSCPKHLSYLSHLLPAQPQPQRTKPQFAFLTLLESPSSPSADSPSSSPPKARFIPPQRQDSPVSPTSSRRVSSSYGQPFPSPISEEGPSSPPNARFIPSKRQGSPASPTSPRHMPSSTHFLSPPPKPGSPISLTIPDSPISSSPESPPRSALNRPKPQLHSRIRDVLRLESQGQATLGTLQSPSPFSLNGHNSPPPSPTLKRRLSPARRLSTDSLSPISPGSSPTLSFSFPRSSTPSPNTSPSPSLRSQSPSCYLPGGGVPKDAIEPMNRDSSPSRVVTSAA